MVGHTKQQFRGQSVFFSPRKVLIFFIFLFLLTAGISYYFIRAGSLENRSGASSASENQSSFSANLSSIGMGVVNVNVSYDNPNAVGDPYPNYEYPSQIIKFSPTDYRMIYGGRCVYDADGNCQIPTTVCTKERKNGDCKEYGPGYAIPGNLGDGDAPRYAASADGIHWSRSLTPLLRKGRYDKPPAPIDSYDWGNKMDASVVKWGNTYYMYYNAEYDYEQMKAAPANCPRPAGYSYPTWDVCGEILYATSTDMVHWTKPQNLHTLVIKNGGVGSMYNWPKAMVVDGQIWLYVTKYVRDSNYQVVNFEEYLIKSTDPTAFDFNQKIRIFTNVRGQPAVLWPNEPTKRVFVMFETDWPYQIKTGYWVPTLVFSKDGVTWTAQQFGGSTGMPLSMKSTWHTFCSIATELNGGVPVAANDPSRVDTLFSCSTSNGQNCMVSGNGICQTQTGKNNDIWHANIAVGHLSFSLNAPAGTPAPTPLPTPTSTMTPIPPNNGVGRVQGYKVQSNSTFADKTVVEHRAVTLDGKAPTTANPYFFNSIPVGQHTISVSVPAGYKAGYTLCVNRVDCHGATPTTGNKVTVNIPKDGYVDLWWHLYDMRKRLEK